MKTHIRLALPVILSFMLVVGVALPALTSDAEAGTPNTVVSPISKDGFIKTVSGTTAIKPMSNDQTKANPKPADSKPKAAVTIRVHGENTVLSTLPLLLDSTTYVPLYDFCKLIDTATMTQYEDSTVINLPDLQIEATANNFYIIANGRYLYTPTLCRMVDNVMYVPIRPLVKAFGLSISWYQPSRTITISPNYGYDPIEHGDTFYNKTDLLWLSRIISAESRGESMDGKIAVGNVIMNRLRSPSFPNSVHGVIFDRRSGIQFSPAYSGAINNTPDASCIIAAKLALDGANVVDNSLYFNQARLRSWASRNRTFVVTIGNHSFFA